MNSPICDFVRKYAQSEKARFHMPGHKGKSFLGFENLDITEIDGADVLYNAKGIIRESEENASRLFSSGKTLYSTEGSSLSIRAMLYLASLLAKQNGKKPVIAAFRNVHKAFVSAAALLDFETSWIYPKDQSGIISCKMSPDELDAVLSDFSEKPTALYVTSPDYLGNIQDIKGFSEICKKHGMLLLVDNAHGAYLKFLSEDLHPLTLGADMCCDSAHKTLPVLTGGAYLHISVNAPSLFSQQAERAMSLFASTSPSYLILQSLDMANKYIYDGYREKLSCVCKKVSEIKEKLIRNGCIPCGNEPLKITIETKPFGYTGTGLSDILLSKNIVCEFCDSDYIVFMITPENADKLNTLPEALRLVEKRNAISEKAPLISRPERIMSIRQAMFSDSEKVPVQNSVGRVFADAVLGCPPAVPIIISGEVIDENTEKLFGYYGITHCSTVKE